MSWGEDYDRSQQRRKSLVASGDTKAQDVLETVRQNIGDAISALESKPAKVAEALQELKAARGKATRASLVRRVVRVPIPGPTPPPPPPPPPPAPGPGMTANTEVFAADDWTIVNWGGKLPFCVKPKALSSPTGHDALAEPLKCFKTEAEAQAYIDSKTSDINVAKYIDTHDVPPPAAPKK